MGILKWITEKLKRSQAKSSEFNFADGETIIKIDDNHYEHHISKELWQTRQDDRRRKDDVLKLLQKPGIHLKIHGRGGCLYITDNNRIAEIDCELGATALLLAFESLTHWTIPIETLMTTEEKGDLKEKLFHWAKETQQTISIY